MIEIADPSEEAFWEDTSPYEDTLPPPCYFSTFKWCTQPALTRVCRQLRSETLPVYYGINAFVAYIEGTEDWPHFNQLQTWLGSMLMASRRLLRNLQVRFECNVSTIGLVGDRVAKRLQFKGYEIATAAVTSWVALNARYTDRREFDDWNKVQQAKTDAKRREEEKLEEEFKNERMYAGRTRPKLPFEWQ